MSLIGRWIHKEMYAQASNNFHVLNNASDGTMFSPMKLRDLAQHKDEQHMTSCVLAACQPAPSRRWTITCIWRFHRNFSLSLCHHQSNRLVTRHFAEIM